MGRSSGKFTHPRGERQMTRYRHPGRPGASVRPGTALPGSCSHAPARPGLAWSRPWADQGGSAGRGAPGEGVSNPAPHQILGETGLADKGGRILRGRRERAEAGGASGCRRLGAGEGEAGNGTGGAPGSGSAGCPDPPGGGRFAEAQGPAAAGGEAAGGQGGLAGPGATSRRAGGAVPAPGARQSGGWAGKEAVGHSVGHSVTHPCGGWGAGERSSSGTPPPPRHRRSLTAARSPGPSLSFGAGDAAPPPPPPSASTHARTHAGADGRTHARRARTATARRCGAVPDWRRGGSTPGPRGLLRTRATARLPLPFSARAGGGRAGKRKGAGPGALRLRSSHPQPLEVGGASAGIAQTQSLSGARCGLCACAERLEAGGSAQGARARVLRAEPLGPAPALPRACPGPAVRGDTAGGARGEWAVLAQRVPV